jgi:outer membrane protein OmpA-like peptidoglycan-associated protein
MQPGPRGRRATHARLRATGRSALGVSAAALTMVSALLCTERTALAQQSTFKLDRLEMPGAPDDTMTQFRPAALEPRPFFFGQVALGYSRRPLRLRNIIDPNDRTTLAQTYNGQFGSAKDPVENQLTMYANLGFAFLDRFIVGVNLPFTPYQDGQVPRYSQTNAIFTGGKTTTFDSDGPAIGDLRLDLRSMIVRSENRKFALGGQLNIFFPTGSSNWGGDSYASALFMLSGEANAGPFTFLANTGFHLRHLNSINDPTSGYGLGIGNEWRYSLGGFANIKGGKYRIGASIFGQTGFEDAGIIGNTFFTRRNSPLEWNVEGRMRLGKGDRMWLGVSAGTLIMPGYGAPDFRGVATFGIQIPLRSSEGIETDPKLALREKWKKEHGSVDTDGDGIIDDFDACPNDPEDHEEPDPNDGCPKPKAPPPPPKPVDTDGDGILDTEDFCPKEPGKRSSEPNRNGCPENISREGGTIRTFRQVQFAFGSATILPESFPMLQEIVNLLKANPGIKRLAVEGHTDNKGSATLNKNLSQNRANSVMKWLVDHGIEAPRLEAHGYGMEKPVADNKTDEGRAQNRRVEFKILVEE